MFCQCFSRGFPQEFPCLSHVEELWAPRIHVLQLFTCEVGEQKLLFISFSLKQDYQLANWCWRELVLSQELGRMLARSLCYSSVAAVKPWQHFPFLKKFSFIFKHSLFELWTKPVFSKCLYSVYLDGLCFPLGLFGAFLGIIEL